MSKVNIICGYGVPKDIFKDENYHFYLNMVFNSIFDTISVKEMPQIIFTGGETDCYKPYKRNEAAEMKKFFQVLMKRPFVQTQTKKWKLQTEKKSLSTLENLLFCKALIKQQKIKIDALSIYCEKTREKRVKTLSKKVFPRTKIQIHAIDFDVSMNRYDKHLIQEKEAMVIKHDLWALKSAENMKKYHKRFEEKVAFLRSENPSKHAEMVQLWWKKNLKKIN